MLSASSADGIGAVTKGQAFGEAVVLVLPGMTAEETQTWAVEKQSAGSVLGAKLSDGTVVLTNLGGGSAKGKLLGVVYDLAPLASQVVTPTR